MPSALTAHDKDPTLILFRALGKVLYCKREESQEACEDLLPAHLKHHARAQMSFVPEQVCVSFVPEQVRVSFVQEQVRVSFVPEQVCLR